MFATVITFEESPEQLDAGIEHVEADVLPALRNAVGLTGVWLVNRETGKRLSVLVWESEEHAEAGWKAVEELRNARGDTPRPVPASVERYEVYGQAGNGI